MPHRLTLTEMAAKIQARQMSPVELLESHVRQIERWNPRLNAFAITVFDEARPAADGCTRWWEGRQDQSIP
jgi:aspartyl-tRNA(Asn)/glutamyl-tRNA(Gln) amidotransferase subunit A